MLYLSLKAVHLIAMVAWFAGLFYLPRLFVYHCDAVKRLDRPGDLRFQTMERRLLVVIATPAGLLTWATGLAMLALRPALLQFVWMWAVLGLSATLVGFHIYCAWCTRRFQRGTNTHSPRFYRLFNEWPTLVLIAVILLFVFRPGG